MSRETDPESNGETNGQTEGQTEAGTDQTLLSAAEMVAGFAAGSLSPLTVTEACLARIAALNPGLNAFSMVDAEGALEAARKSAARYEKCRPKGPLDGVPVSIKDTLLVKGWPCRRGSRTVDPEGPWDEDSPAVARLRESGAIFLGRTTTPEFGWKGVTDSPLTGITRSPWNPELTPGGSSGGAAVAAATGMAAINLGTDGGGSVRIPAAFTGVVGLKPSTGRIPYYPVSPFGTIVALGPLTRTVEDAALALTVLGQPDRRDWTALPDPPPDYTGELERGVAGLRIAFAPTYESPRGDHPVDPEIDGMLRNAASELRRQGAMVQEVAPPLAGAGDIFGTVWAAGLAAIEAGIPEEKRRLMDPGLRAMAARGRDLSAVDLTRATLARAALARAMANFHQVFDILLMPTEPIPPFAAGHDAPPDGPYAAWEGWTPFTYPFNLTMQPAISVPCGLTEAGQPAGLQIIGALHNDALVLRAARAFERAHPPELPALPVQSG